MHPLDLTSIASLAARVRALPLALGRDQRGVSAIEFAFVAPLLVALFVCIADLGMGIYTNTQLANAAQYGTAYAVQNGYNSANIVTAVRSETSLSNVTVSSSQFCGCPGSSGITQTACSATCSDGLSPGTFTQIAAAKDYSTILPYPGLPSTFHLSQQSTVRLK
jgi:Flp pilus assembly protein TadG